MTARALAESVKQCDGCAGSQTVLKLCTYLLEALDKIERMERWQPNCEMHELQSRLDDVNATINLMKCISGNLERAICVWAMREAKP